MTNTAGQTWQDSAQSALTNLLDLGTNTLTGITNAARAKINSSQTNQQPVPINAPIAASDNNLVWIIGGVALFYLFLRKK